MQRKSLRKLGVGLAFIGPNVVGFLVFMLFPLVFSLAMAFTNWDLRLHNIFQSEPVRFVGFGNFSRLFNDPDFLKYLGNTLFFMMGIPFAIAGSLMAAILLSQELRGGSNRQVWARLILTAILVSACGMLVLLGMGASAMAILIGGIAGLILVGGTLGGRTVHRTLFYFPHFTAGVATFLLWKKLYSPHTGPINHALRPLLGKLGDSVSNLSPSLVHGGSWLCAIVALLVLIAMTGKLRHWWRDGEAGWLSLLLGGLLLYSPVLLWYSWSAKEQVGWLGIAVVCGSLIYLATVLIRSRDFSCVADKGLGPVLVTCGSVMVLQLAMIGMGNVLHVLPEISQDGLNPPEWLTNYGWAKPAIMMMGLWAAIGSNNMLLYLAGLSNIPVELYEAADIDGASRTQRFWQVTWPQLAPVTFFIIVMAVIGGLQGGFEMARTMTQGGPAGSTTTLSYYVYTEGFETGRLGYASAVAWTLFALVFSVTLFNWKFGNRYTND